MSDDKLNNTLEEISGELEKASKIAIVSHYHPDADAYGSLGSLALGLGSLGKSVSIFNQDGLSERYAAIPGLSDLQSSVKQESFDLWIICDCGDKERTGKTFQGAIASAKKVINLDHHISNDHFGTLNLVDPDASSTCEIIFRLLENLQIEFTPDLGVALLSGIIGDTGSFQYSNTSPACFDIASKLVSKGAELSRVTKMLYGSYSASAVKMQAEAVLNLQLHFGGKVSEIMVDRDLLKKHSATSEDTELLVEKARDIKGVEIAFFIREDKDVWKVSLRSSVPAYDLSALASSFGGGGHRAAAAFRWSGAYHELREKLLSGLEELVNQ